MWYRIRYAYYLLLTIFQIIGLALLVLGTAVIVLLWIGLLLSAVQKLLGYELLLTDQIVSSASAFAIVSCCLGALIALLGLGATPPQYLRE